MALIGLMPPILIGCVTVPLYQASVTDPAQGAVLRAWSSGKTATFGTFIELVDDRLLYDGLRASDEAQFGTGVLVNPGVRTLNVAATYWGGLINYTGRAKLTATLESGHTYILKAERTGTLITLWLEDQETHEAVSEGITAKASRWIKFP